QRNCGGRITSGECDRTRRFGTRSTKERCIDRTCNTRQFLGGVACCGDIVHREQDLDCCTKGLGADGRASLLLELMTDCNGRSRDLHVCEPEQRKAGVWIAARLARTSIQILRLLKFSSQPV